MEHSLFNLISEYFKGIKINTKLPAKFVGNNLPNHNSLDLQVKFVEGNGEKSFKLWLLLKGNLASRQQELTRSSVRLSSESNIVGYVSQFDRSGFAKFENVPPDEYNLKLIY